MPELPDVAGFKQYLDATSLHQTIAHTECRDDRIVQDVSRQGLQQRLKGASLEKSHRRGKWLLVELASKGYLVLHFGMTGELTAGGKGKPLPDHSRFILHFQNDTWLAILSQRLLGRVSHTEDPDRWAREHDLGPDALDESVDTRAFREIFQGRRGSIKSALMNQSLLAGIGNVYSDEILFQAGVHPAARIDDLSQDTLRTLFRKMNHVLRHAAQKGGNGSAMPDSWLLGNRRKAGTCPRCDGSLRKTTIGGRTSWFCPACQPKP